MNMLAYTPFIDPLNLHGVWWLLLLPLALGISVVYKAVRLTEMDRYVLAVLGMTLQIVVAMIGLTVVAYVFVEVYLNLFG